MGIMNSGVKQWLFQRFSNVLFVTFGICLLWVFLSGGGLSYASLKALFASSGWKIYFAIVLVFACLNSVLAGWQIDGDYAKKFGLPKMALTWVAVIVSAAFLVYGLMLIFG